MVRLDSLQRDNQAMRKELATLRQNNAQATRQAVANAPSRSLPQGVTTAMAAAPSGAHKAQPYRSAPVHDWTGIYLGGHVGYGGSSIESTLNSLAGAPAGQTLGSGNIGGGLGGVQVGANYQFRNIVLGVQGDFSWADIAGQTCNARFNGTIICRSNLAEISTVTGRFGIASDNFLAYVKGGAAWARNESQVAITLGGPPLIATNASTMMGYTAGAGLEYAFDRSWSAFAEYDFVGFGTQTDGYIIGAIAPPDNNTAVLENRQRIHIVKFGINYKFDWLSNASVVAY